MKISSHSTLKGYGRAPLAGKSLCGIGMPGPIAPSTSNLVPGMLCSPLIFRTKEKRFLSGMSVIGRQPFPRLVLSSDKSATAGRFGRSKLFPCAAKHNKSLDASGGGVSRNLLGAAKDALIRAAASTQTLSRREPTVRLAHGITA